MTNFLLAVVNKLIPLPHEEKRSLLKFFSGMAKKGAVVDPKLKDLPIFELFNEKTRFTALDVKKHALPPLHVCSLF